MRHQVRWFMEPFGYAEASRAAQRQEKRGNRSVEDLADARIPSDSRPRGHVFFNSDAGGTLIGDHAEVLTALTSMLRP